MRTVTLTVDFTVVLLEEVNPDDVIFDINLDSVVPVCGGLKVGYVPDYRTQEYEELKP